MCGDVVLFCFSFYKEKEISSLLLCLPLVEGSDGRSFLSGYTLLRRALRRWTTVLAVFRKGYVIEIFSTATEIRAGILVVKYSDARMQ